MSYADECFIATCKDILENGTDTRNEEVRPKWPDGTSAYTIKKFGIVNKYDLQKEFPAITVRKTGLKSAMDEILWIYQRKSNNIHDLNSHIWDQWADEKGSIGKAYGYQIGRKFFNIMKVNKEDVYGRSIYDYLCTDIFKDLPSFDIYECIDHDEFYEIRYEIDQMDYVLYELKYHPFSRRIMTTLWNTKDLFCMNLYPCAWSVTYSVTEKNGKKYLNMFLNQRSQDMLAANNWNTAQYAILLMMVAQASNMEPGELIHSIVDAHIYDRHIPIIEELIKRPTYPAPKVSLNKKIKNFYDFDVNDLIVEDYKAGEQVKFEVAI